jgi:putative pyruvate formate lyase activating enzyme
MAISTDQVQDILNNCTICPRKCGVNRINGELGFCKAGADLEISSANLHLGEEPPISGSAGSGTIFLTHCNMHCVYCQNYPISQHGNGRQVTQEELVATMLNLQKRGAHNINFVTPTHYTPQLALIIQAAKTQGLTIPIVWNTSSFESPEGLEIVNGLVDVYLADIRYMNSNYAFQFSQAKDYPLVMKQALQIMYQQVGNLIMSDDGVALRGLIIRHLVLPEDVASTKEALTYLVNEISPDIYVSLMSQYFPAYKARVIPPLNRGITKKEYRLAKNVLAELGIENGWVQSDPV